MSTVNNKKKSGQQEPVVEISVFKKYKKLFLWFVLLFKIRIYFWSLQWAFESEFYVNPDFLIFFLRNFFFLLFLVSKYKISNNFEKNVFRYSSVQCNEKYSIAMEFHKIVHLCLGSDWQPVQGEPCLCPTEARTGSCDPLTLKGI